MRKLFSVAALSLLLTGSIMAATPGTPMPQIWFSMGALTSPAGQLGCAFLRAGRALYAAPPRPSMSNQDWPDDAVRNFTHIERTLRVSPDWVSFASWEKFPGHALTDSYGVGEDYLVKQYLQLHGPK